MTFDNYINNYGFTVYTDTFPENPRVSPHLIRYLGMGTYQLLASFHKSPEKYSLITIGGASNADRKFNLNIFKCISESDGKSLSDLHNDICTTPWSKSVANYICDSGTFAICESSC